MSGSTLKVFGPEDRFHRFESALGEITLAASPAGLRGLWFSQQHYFPDLPEPLPKSGDPLLQQAEAELVEYFSGKRKRFTLRLDLSHGTAFQQQVWKVLLEIPFGETTDYSRVAASAGRPDAVRAASAAIGRNPVSVIVPCHRVLGRNGSLTGYAGGLERKQALLQLEGHHDLLG